MTTVTKKSKTAKAKGDGEVKLRIRVRAYENKILDASVKQIMDTAMRYDATLEGPIPMPTEIKKYTVNRYLSFTKTLVNSLRLEFTSVLSIF